MSMLIRTIIIIPVMLVLVMMAFIIGAVADPIYELVYGNAALASLGWGGLPDTVMTWFALCTAAFGLSLLVWHLAAPIQEDSQQFRRW